MRMRLRPKPRPAKATTNNRAWGRSDIRPQRGSRLFLCLAAESASGISVEEVDILARLGAKPNLCYSGCRKDEIPGPTPRAGSWGSVI